MRTIDADALLDYLNEHGYDGLNAVVDLMPTIPATLVSYEERETVYKAALHKWGTRAQLNVVIEELSELTKEVCKLLRGNHNMDALAEEIADVTIMLEQLRLMYGLDADVCGHIDDKVRRLERRIVE